MECLRWCRMVADERQGRQVLYRVADPRIGRLLAQGRELAAEHRKHLTT